MQTINKYAERIVKFYEDSLNKSLQKIKPRVLVGSVNLIETERIINAPQKDISVVVNIFGEEVKK